MKTEISDILKNDIKNRFDEICDIGAGVLIWDYVVQVKQLLTFTPMSEENFDYICKSCKLNGERIKKFRRTPFSPIQNDKKGVEQ